MPDTSEVQRQIIIDSEKAIEEKSAIPKKEFTPQ